MGMGGRRRSIPTKNRLVLDEKREKEGRRGDEP